MPTGDVPDAIKQMIQDRHDARAAAEAAAEAAAIVVLPAATRRDIAGRAASIGARWRWAPGAARSAWWSRCRARRSRTQRRDAGAGTRAGEPGPGILETSLVLGLAVILAVAILAFFGGPLAGLIGIVVDAAHGGG